MSKWRGLRFVLGFDYKNWSKDARLYLKRPPFLSFTFGIKLYFCALVVGYHAPHPNCAHALSKFFEVYWRPTCWNLAFAEGDRLWRKQKTLYLARRTIWLEDLNHGTH